MRVSLISPLTIGLSPREASEKAYGDAPLGILTLAAVARLSGYNPAVFDLDHLSHEIPPDRFVSDCAGHIAAAGADWIGLGTICDSYPLTLRLARELRRLLPRAFLCLGGPQATATDMAALRAMPEIDAVVRGEAETILPVLLHAVEHGRALSEVPGLTYRWHGNIQRTPSAPLITDLEELPDPAWDLDPILLLRPDASVEMGRGCPFACEFCSTNDFFRRKYRMKSPARVLGQMAELERRYGIRHFSLVHDMFTVDRKRVVAFSEAAAQFGRPYTWGCSARTDCVDAELLQTMHKGGCRKVFFGVETGSARLQNSIQKGLDLQQARAVIQTTSALEMQSTVSLIAGFPDEDESDLRATADMYLYAARFDRADVQLHMLGALPGTPFTVRHQHQTELDLHPDAWSGDPADLAEITAHADLYINFYSLPSTLPRRKVREFTWFLANAWQRCHWLLQSLHRECGHIWDLFGQFDSETENRTPDWYRSLDFRQALFNFVGEQTTRRALPHSALLLSFYRQLDHLGASTNASAHGRPTLPAGAILAHCRGDVLATIEALRTGAPLPPIRPEDNWILVRTTAERHGELIHLSQSSGRLLRLCNGRRTTAQIGREAKRAALAPSTLRDAVVGEVLLQKLAGAGLVQLNPEAFGAAHSQSAGSAPAPHC